MRISSGLIAAAGGLATLAPSAANANLIFCNKFTEQIYVAIAYQQKDGSWISRGWLNVDPGRCAYFDSSLTLNGYYYRVESAPYRLNGHQAVEVWGDDGDGTFAIWDKNNFQYWNAQAKPLNSTMAKFTRIDDAVSEHVDSIVNIFKKQAPQ